MAKQKPLSDISDLLDVIKEERNRLTVGALKVLQKEQPGTFDNFMSLRVGSRTFKDFQPIDLKKIDRAFQNYSVIDLSGGAVAEASIVAYRNVIQLAERHRVTGRYAQSLSIFVRPVGGIDREISVSKLIRQDIPERPVVSIISDVPYAAKLESLTHHGRRQGFLFYVSKIVKREFGKAIDIKFDYFSSARLSKGSKKSLPRLQISNPGDLRGRSRKPKSK